MTTKGMKAVLNSALFFVLFFTETIAPICDPDFQIAAGSDPDPWDDSPHWDTDRDYKINYCVWKSWDSWSGCFGGTKTRYRVKEVEVNNCRCDIEFQTQSCVIFGKSPKISVLVSAGPQWTCAH